MLSFRVVILYIRKSSGSTKLIPVPLKSEFGKTRQIAGMYSADSLISDTIKTFPSFLSPLPYFGWEHVYNSAPRLLATYSRLSRKEKKRRQYSQHSPPPSYQPLNFRSRLWRPNPTKPLQREGDGISKLRHLNYLNKKERKEREREGNLLFVGSDDDFIVVVRCFPSRWMYLYKYAASLCDHLILS